MKQWKNTGEIYIEDESSDYLENDSNSGNHTFKYPKLDFISYGDNSQQHFGYSFNELTNEYCCNHCYYKSTYKSSTTRHLRTHSGYKPFICGFCQYTTAHSSSLKVHMRIHTGEKPYVCEFCSKAFSDKSNLIRHLRVHSDARFYTCQFCRMSFCSESDLELHIQTHN